MVTHELASLLDEIDVLLATPVAGGSVALAHVEETLTDGYARALGIEAERRRIERRLAELARHVAGGGAAAVERELAELSGRLERADRDLALLRERLASLRRHAAAVRAA